MYLTYEEYKSYGGTMPESEFVMRELYARKYIDKMTDGRVAAMDKVPEEVKHCMMRIFSFEASYGAEAQNKNPVIASFSNDGYSESYGSVSEQLATARKSLNDFIMTMLFGVLDDDGVPLIYRGVITHASLH